MPDHPLPAPAMPARLGLPVFETLGPGLWRAPPVAAGPFAGVQGGAVAGLLAAAIEAEAPPGYRPLSCRVDFLRLTPVGAPLAVRVTPVQMGRRLAVFDAAIEAGGRVTARGSLTLASEVAVPGLAEDFLGEAAPPAPDPAALPARRVPAPHGKAWLIDLLDPRLAPDGSVWFRWLVPLLPGISAFAAALGPADFCHGLGRPGLPGPAPVPGYPNPDLSVQFDRAPRGPWIGVRPVTRWRRSGLGLGYGDLVDLEGSFGRVAMGVVLLPG